MNDRVLNPQFEQNLFQENEQLPQDFWQRYFAIQKVATMVDWQDGSFTVQITDEKTGKTKQFENVHFATDKGFQLN